MGLLETTTKRLSLREKTSGLLRTLSMVAMVVTMALCAITAIHMMVIVLWQYWSDVLGGRFP